MGFEGGQTPLRQRLPKVGAYDPFARELVYVNLDRLSKWIEDGRIDASKLITMKTLRDTGLARRNVRDGAWLRDRGHDAFAHTIDIEVTQVDPEAKRAIEARGGTARSVYYNALGLRALLKPHKFPPALFPRPARPPPKLRPHFEYVGRLPEPTEPLPSDED